MAITIKDQDKNKQVQPAANQPRQVGTGFTSVQRVAQANQGNRLNQTVGTGVQQAGQQTKQAVTGAQQQFQQQAKQTGLTSDQDVNATQQGIQQVLADPTKADDNTVQKFAQYRSGQYGGPTNLANAEQLQQQATQAQQLGQNLASSGGRTALLQRFAAKPAQTYTSGQSRLDLALMGQGPQQQLAQAQRATAGLGSQLDTAQQAAQAQAQEYQARAEGLKKFTEGKIGEQINPLTGELESKASTENTRLSDVIRRIKSGTATAEDFQAAGLGDLAGQETYGTDIRDYVGLANPQGAASRANIASDQQRARLAALGKLGGMQDLSKEFGEAQAYDPSKQFVGTDTAKKAVEQKRKDYEEDVKRNTTTNQQLEQELIQQLLNQSRADAIRKNQQLSENINGNNPLSGQPTLGKPTIGQQEVQSKDASDLMQRYLSAGEDKRKRIREEELSDSSIYGKNRDAIVNEMLRLENQQKALEALKQKYNIGKKFGQ